MAAEAGASNHAILLAAGLGQRLGAELDGRAKPLIDVGGKSLLEHALERLGEASVTDVTVAVGYGADVLVDVLRLLCPHARTVHNPDPVGTGSMRSLALAGALARDAEWDNVLVLEGDVLFEARALDELLSAPPADASVLVSGPTGAGDEVWVCGAGTRITEISKQPTAGADTIGELVGITRLTRAMLQAMSDEHHRLGNGAALEDYEARISEMSATHAVRAHLVPDLLWGEIDDPHHLRRVRDEVLPAVERATGP